MRRPNLLFVMTDQHRWDALSCVDDWVETPALDKLASEGLRFSECVTNSPLCISARVSLATGRYPHNTGVWQNLRYNMAADTPTWMQVIRQAGYRTSLFGKTHLHISQDLRDGEPLLHALGFDDVDEITDARGMTHFNSHLAQRWASKGLLEPYRTDIRDRTANDPYSSRASVLPLEDYLDVYVGEQAAAYLASYDRAEPWFCTVSFGGPHEPWDAPEPFASRYQAAAMPTPQRRASTIEGRPQGQFDGWWTTFDGPKPEQIPGMRANYAGNVTLIDEQIGEILNVIARRGEMQNTAVIFTSDHGEMNGDQGLVGKANFLGSSVKIPLIVRTPETASASIAGSVSASPVELIDVGATLVELAGGEYQHRQFAKSLVPVLDDPTLEHRPFAISEVMGEAMITRGKWKIAFNNAGQAYMTFDLEQDPMESRNLAGSAETAAIEAELRQYLVGHFLQSSALLDAI